MSSRAPQSVRGGGANPRSSVRQSKVRDSGTSKMTSKRGGVGASSRRSGAAAQDALQTGGVPTVLVDGLDVTPRPLVPVPNQAGVAKVEKDGESGSESQSSAAFDAVLGGRGGSNIGSDDGMSGTEPEASDAEADAPAAAKQGAAAATGGGGAVASAPEDVKTLTAEELESLVTLELTETETFFLLDMPGSSVGMDDPAELEAVKAMNAAYDELLEKRNTMADMYVESPAQTFNLDLKPKEQQTHNVRTSETGTQASDWEIFDAYGDMGSAAAPDDAVAIGDALAAAGGSGGGSVSGAGGGSAVGGDGSSFAASGTESSMHESSAVDAAASVADEGAGSAAGGGKAAEVSLKTLGPALLGTLRIVERMVSQNIYQSKHLRYRSIEPPGSKLSKAANRMADEMTGALMEGGSGSASFSLLWTFISEEKTAGRNVSCLEWNEGNPDLLAVGYGEVDFAKAEKADGLICFWSLKNPESADKMLRTACGVTAIAFSRQHPNLLAAGLYDGTVAVYDVRKVEKADAKPMLESGHGTGGKHTDPVWQLAWVPQGGDRGEILVSISSDGRVTKWDMKKGLENSDLMKLKRVTNAAKQKEGGGGGGGAGGGSEGIISRRASGMCMAFNTRDSNFYLAGTEDGHIHRCSCSYSEQHLDSFFGHSGPVYKLRWSPFAPNIFLSCSADWTIKLWDQESPNAVFTFSSTTDYVADIAWSPNNSTVFASVTGDGRIDVWDISINTLDPLTSFATGLRLSTVAFSIASPVLVVGHEGGGVDLYTLEGSLAEPLGRTVQEQIDALEKVTSTVQDESPAVPVH